MFFCKKIPDKAFCITFGLYYLCSKFLLFVYACMAEAYSGYLFDTDSVVAVGVTSFICAPHTKLYCRTGNEICF